MTITELKDYVASFMNRSQSSIVTANNTFDLLLRAINNAKTYMQRRHNFEMANVQVTVPLVDVLNGANLSTAVLYGTLTPVVVKTLLRAFLHWNGVTNWAYPIDIVDRSTHIKRLQRKVNRVLDTTLPLSQSNLTGTNVGSFVSCVRQGQMVYLTANDQQTAGSTTLPVSFDAVQWMPDYSSTITTDFFSEFCPDFLVFRTMCELNLFLKEDNRFSISKVKMDEEWANVLAWDTNLIIGSSDSIANLD